ncbi:MAG: hypothetical protein HZA61_07450 [Candidatus Eisenbacteria bacterium]|uniref:Uncharacterized protein n=1 Tax=Eiseniibacteriota bacterium TaxID=2212470 RepID=A0A933WAH3_UNCEI|nr:hypothetical protein [Candidatus Eisenbacteria bacterium]
MPRRVVLIDFDWQDADLLPELLKRPGVSVRLVAGERVHDPGVRVAELCGLPRTLDLADLTREIFDLAIVGERSSRRTQLESLLLALGTPCQTLQEFMQGTAESADESPAIEAPLALHAATLEHTLGGGDYDALLEQALPDLGADAPVAPAPVPEPAQPHWRVSSLEDFPSPESRARLESALKELVGASGANTAELHAGDTGPLQLVAQVGPEDKLLKGLVDLASELGTPQVVTRLSEPGKGRTWGAWPFRTTQRRGVLAVAAIESPQGMGQWQSMVEDLRNTWDEEDRERAGTSFPYTPLRESGWLDAPEFRKRIELALERNRHDRMRFELHRIEFPDHPVALQALFEQFPAQVRDTDCLMRGKGSSLLLLTAGQADGFSHLRRRLLQLWDRVWRENGPSTPAPAIVDHCVTMAGPEDADAFLAAAHDWLS